VSTVVEYADFGGFFDFGWYTSAAAAVAVNAAGRMVGGGD